METDEFQNICNKSIPNCIERTDVGVRAFSNFGLSAILLFFVYLKSNELIRRISRNKRKKNIVVYFNKLIKELIMKCA
jgi:hypothetical protein